MSRPKAKRRIAKRLGRAAHGSLHRIARPSYHLYYRLPWRNAAIGQRGCSKYTVLRSDTEKMVCYADTRAEAERICRSWPSE